LLRRKGTIRNKGFYQAAQQDRKSRKLAPKFGFAGGKQIELVG